MDGQPRHRHIGLPGLRPRQHPHRRRQAADRWARRRACSTATPTRWNPEETLIAALVECHLLSYLYVAAQNGIVVESYTDAATGTIQTEGEGGRFTEVTLRPVVTISSGDPELAQSLHDEAERLCFIAQSVNFPVRHEPTIEVRLMGHSHRRHPVQPSRAAQDRPALRGGRPGHHVRAVLRPGVRVLVHPGEPAHGRGPRRDRRAAGHDRARDAVGPLGVVRLAVESGACRPRARPHGPVHRVDPDLPAGGDHPAGVPRGGRGPGAPAGPAGLLLRVPAHPRRSLLQGRRRRRRAAPPGAADVVRADPAQRRGVRRGCADRRTRGRPGSGPVAFTLDSSFVYRTSTGRWRRRATGRCTRRRTGSSGSR